ncbi:MAG: S1C family serine protease [Nitrospirota bacterium]
MTFQYLRHVLVTGFVLVFLSPLAARANTPDQIFVQVSPSVVVHIFDAKGKSVGQGSGAVIGAGQVITNCHVAQKGESLKVRQLGKTFKATLQYADPDRDLCQLSVQDLQAQPVVLGTASKLRIGQRVYAIGAPKGLELTLSEGLISSLRPYEGSQYIQTSAAIFSRVLPSSGAVHFHRRVQSTLPRLCASRGLGL